MLSTANLAANGLLKQSNAKQNIDQHRHCPADDLSDAAMRGFVRKLYCVCIFVFVCVHYVP